MTLSDGIIYSDQHHSIRCDWHTPANIHQIATFFRYCIQDMTAFPLFCMQWEDFIWSMETIMWSEWVYLIKVSSWIFVVQHEWEGKWKEGCDEAWSTVKKKYFSNDQCTFCCHWLEWHLDGWQAHFPEHLVPVLLTSANVGLVEFHFADPEDGVSEWTYWLVHMFSEKECKSLGSPICNVMNCQVNFSCTWGWRAQWFTNISYHLPCIYQQYLIENK
jgi:hypothetical protein